MNEAQQKIKKALETCDPEQFKFRDVSVCGEEAVLVTPAISGTNWNKANKYLRSCIYRKSDYFPISLGFPKFTNFGENPDQFPTPNSLVNSVIVSKEDGSLFCATVHNDIFNVRTRGSVGYENMDNSGDFDYCLEKYPKIKKLCFDNPDYTFLFEIVTPNLQIILKYPEIDLFLIGAVNKNNYKIDDQKTLDHISKKIDVPRPKYYSFDSLNALIKTIENSENIEGCVLYSEIGIHKIKSSDYLKKHAFKSNVSLNNILDLYLDNNFNSLEEFKQYIIETFDWECWLMVEDLIIKMIECKEELDGELMEIRDFVEENRSLSQKEFAKKNLELNYKPYCNFAFAYRNGKDIGMKSIKDTIKQKI